MRCGCAFSSFRNSANHDNHRFRMSNLCESLEKFSSSRDTLKIQGNHTSFCIIHQLLKSICFIEIRLISEREKLRKSELPTFEDISNRNRHGTRLGDDPDISWREKLSSKTEIESDLCISITETVGSKKSNPILLSYLMEPIFFIFFPDFSESSRDDDGLFNPKLSSRFQGIVDKKFWNRKNGDIRNLWKGRNIRIKITSIRGTSFWIHSIDPSRKMLIFG